MYLPNLNDWKRHFLDIIEHIPLDKVNRIADIIWNSSQTVLAGNGGSYANATHIAGDILCNTPYTGNTITLGDNTVALMALSNDISYQDALAAEYQLRHRNNTVVLLLSTSGKSKNIIQLAKVAEKMGAGIISITGQLPDKDLLRYSLIHMELPSLDAAMIESAYDFIGHCIVKALQSHIPAITI